MTGEIQEAFVQYLVSVINHAIDEERVTSNPKYLPHDVTGDGKPETFCNIFTGTVAKKLKINLLEARANDIAIWLTGKSAWDDGWREAVNFETAKSHAAEGCFVVGTWFNPQGHPGHIAILRPDGTWAQAGGHNYEHASQAQCFGNLPVRYHWHLIADQRSSK